jgi:hypothetical protein
MSNSDTLNAGCQGVQVTFSHSIGLENPDRVQPSESQQHERNNDADCKNPPGDRERNSGLDLAGPPGKDEEIDGSEGVYCVDGDGDESKNPQRQIGKRSPARLGFKIIQILMGEDSAI